MSRHAVRAAIAATVLSINTAHGESLPELIVTANRTPLSAEQTLAAVTVIDREAIEASQAHDLIELLDGLAGITTTNSGGLGKQSGIHIRGGNSGHLLVLVDGVRIGSATLGESAIQDLPLAQIERIELVRGPRSALYGADALSGVLQIFTRSGKEQLQPNLHLEGGAHDYRRLSAGLSGSHAATRYSLQLDGQRSEGFDATVGNNPDHDGFRNNSLSTRIEQGIGEAELGLSLMHTQGENIYDGFTATADYRAEYIQQSLGGSLEHPVTEGWASRIQLGQNRDESWNLLDGADNGRFNTLRRQAAWLNDIDLGRGLLVLGLEHQSETVSGSNSYSEDQRRNNALLTEWQGLIGIHDVQLGLRRDESDSYGSHTTGNLAIAHLMRNGMRASIAYGTAFKAPSFNDLYFQDPWGSNGNPNLEPERARSLELGLRGADGDWSLRLYRNEVENQIQWVEIALWTWQPQNVARARINGVELEWSTRMLGWDSRIDLSWMDPRDADSNQLLTRRPQRSARLALERGFGKLDAGLSLSAHGHSYDDAANTTRIPGYALLDARIGYTLARGLRLEARGHNLLDQQHHTVDGYNSTPRGLFIGLRYEG